MSEDPNRSRLVLRGVDAVLACVKHHPRALREVTMTRRGEEALSAHAESLRALGIPLRTVHDSEMSKIAEGPCDDVCAVTFRPEPGLARVGDFTEWRDGHETVVIADGLERPSDLAALARSMSAFGLRRLLLSSGSERLAHDADAWAMAEGALEEVIIMRAAALGGLLGLVQDRCCVVALSPTEGRKIDLAVPVRVPGRHVALLVSGGELNPDLRSKVAHCFRFPGHPDRRRLSLAEAFPVVAAWATASPAPRKDGFLARKRARHRKDKESNPGL
ncbi:MAG: hypothetical protein ACO3ND_10075 [Opitutales bacterium]